MDRAACGPIPQCCDAIKGPSPMDMYVTLMDTSSTRVLYSTVQLYNTERPAMKQVLGHKLYLCESCFAAAT